MNKDLALIGFGEAGSTFARAAVWGHQASGWDVSLTRRKTMKKAGIIAGASPTDTVRHASLILSVVTADQSLSAAETCVHSLTKGAIWCDMNSVAPETKLAAARVIEAAGGSYVDVAIMAPVNPLRLAVPLFLAGPSALQAEFALRAVGFSNVRVVGSHVGQASAIKMIRSVMVKGIEALTAEMMAAATAAGVTDEILASLDASENATPWRERAAYNLERMATHGTRRAAEMEEAAKTLNALGVSPVMTRGTVYRQREAATKRTQL